MQTLIQEDVLKTIRDSIHKVFPPDPKNGYTQQEDGTWVYNKENDSIYSAPEVPSHMENINAGLNECTYKVNKNIILEALSLVKERDS